MRKVFVALCLSVGLSACNSGNVPGTQSITATSPSESVRSMMMFLEKGEVKSAKNFLNTEMKGKNFAIAEANEISKNGIKTLNVEEKSIKGEIANVVALIEDKTGYKRQIIFDMLRENGEWHVAGAH